MRAAPGDRYLSDAEWGEIARRIVHAAGIAPEGDPLACRWIAVRHAEDHIHIVAATVREDGRRPKLHNCGIRAQAEARTIEKELGLYQVAPGDRTGERAQSQAEMHKAERLGWQQTSRTWLQQRIRAAIPHAASMEELFAYLPADGVEVKVRRLPSGDLQGYSVGRPGDLNGNGEQVYIPGGKIAPDLSLPKLQARLATTNPEEYPTARRNRPSSTWQHATSALDALHDHLTAASGIDPGVAHAAGHRPHTLLAEAATRRELHTARLRSHNAGNIPRSAPPQSPTAHPASAAGPHHQRGR